MLKISLLFIAVLAGTTMAVSAAPDPLTWIWQNAWPKAAVTQLQAPTAPVSKGVRPVEHRKVHRPAPKIAKRREAALPKLARPAPIVAKEQGERPKIKRQAKLNCEPRGAGLAPCSVVRACHAQMSRAEQLAAYFNSTSEQVAHGRRCLGI